MDRSDDALEVALEPQTVRTAPMPRRPVSAPEADVAGDAANPAGGPAFVPSAHSEAATPDAVSHHTGPFDCPPSLGPYPHDRVEKVAGPFDLRPAALKTSQEGFIPPTPPFQPFFDAPAVVSAPQTPKALATSHRAENRVDHLKALGLRAARVVAVLFAGWLLLVVAAVFAYRFVDPPVSTLMLQRWLSGEDIRHTWVPLEAISPRLVRAVLVSEDGRFCDHWGVDYEAMEVAIRKAGDGAPRGASTISMQVVKNLFLWPSKSYLRKALELPLTYFMEALWPKSRIMEVYLNIAEWGPGVFGVEEAARYHFSKPAFRLSDREAAQLAVVLPNPFRRDAGDPGPGTRRLAGLIQARARLAGRAQFACIPRPGPAR